MSSARMTRKLGLRAGAADTAETAPPAARRRNCLLSTIISISRVRSYPGIVQAFGRPRRTKGRRVETQTQEQSRTARPHDRPRTAQGQVVCYAHLLHAGLSRRLPAFRRVPDYAECCLGLLYFYPLLS